MRSNREFVIPFEGLKLGKHVFNLNVTDSFFADLEYALIEKGNVDIVFELEKKEVMMIGQFHLQGHVEKPCDRCTEMMQVSIDGSFQVIFKFSEGESEDENLITLAPHEFELKLAPICHEFITVLLPSRVIHEDGDCNEEMVELLKKYTLGSAEDWEDEEGDDGDDDIDPRWSTLKDLN